MDDPREQPDALPEHEFDDDRTTGSGILSEGGTSIDRGTGTLDGTAQGDEERPDDDEPRIDPDDEDPAIQLRTG